MRHGTVEPFHALAKRISSAWHSTPASAVTHLDQGLVSHGAKLCFDLKLRTALVMTPITTISELEALFADANSDERASAGVWASTASGVPQGPDIATLRSARTRFERDYITAVLKQYDWRVADVARALGVDPANLYRKMRRLHIARAPKPFDHPQVLR